MKIFLSWSGNESRNIGTSLEKWLTNIFGDKVEPWISANIRSGDRWLNRLNERLEETKFGILCLTEESQLSPWVLFEAGAIAKVLDVSSVVPVLAGVDKNKLAPPLQQFQALSLNKANASKLAETINDLLEGDKMPTDRLETALERNWGDLEGVVENIEAKYRRAAVDNLLERGDSKHLTIIADAALYLGESRTQYTDELRRHVKAGDAIPSKYLYWTEPAAQHWLELCKRDQYPFYQQSKLFLSSLSGELAEEIVKNSPTRELDFISLGSGDGEKDRIILNSLVSKTSSGEQIYYYPIDVSETLIVESMKSATAGLDKSKFQTKPIIGDFSKLKEYEYIYEYRRDNNIFSILGNTIGNADESMILEAIKGSMRAGDLLIVEVNVGDPNETLLRTDDKINKLHDFSPLEALGMQYDEDKFDYNIEDELSLIPNTKTVVARYEYEAQKPMAQLSNIHHYKPEDLSKYFNDRVGLVKVWSKISKDGVGLMLFRKDVRF